MTDAMPRAPRLREGTCIVTPALLESAQRVFLHHTSSPIHWIDLCTLIETIFLHDRIAFPTVHSEFAEPLLKPLLDSGMADRWWPEANIFNFGGSKETAWKAPTRQQTVRVPLMSGGWPDKNYERLSQAQKDAVDGIAHAFSESALMPENHERSVLLWGGSARWASDDTYEKAATSLLEQGIRSIETLTPAERIAFKRPHEGIKDSYNDYANNIRTLANGARVQVVKSLVEEPFFDPVSIDISARDTLYLLLKKDYESGVVAHINKYIRTIPAPPFAAIAFSKCSNVNDVIRVAIEQKKTYRAYGELLQTYRKLHSELVMSEKLSAQQELKRIEASFDEALKQCMKRLEIPGKPDAKLIFDGLYGLRRIAIAIVKSDYTPFLDRIGGRLLDLAKMWVYTNYGGIYDIVRNYRNISQLTGTSRRLTGRELDITAQRILAKASEVITNNYGLTAVSA
jgi:hypothetical protein